MTEVPAPFGKYYLTEKLAAGGMAEIYLAKLLGPGGFEKLLVLKQIHPKLSGQRHFVDLFVAEAKILVGLVHGNIVPVYELGVIGDTYYIAMEYIDGPSLYRFTEQVRARGETMEPAVAAHIATKILDGLDYAHRKGEGIIHRDLSGRNVMLSRDGEVKLVDFGIAVALGDPGDLAGDTPAGSFPYMSPEQVRREPLTGQSDLFSVGILLWEMLAGERLFARPDAGATLRAVTDAALAPPSAINPAVPGRLDELVMKALERDQSKRWKTAAEMLAALHRYLYSLEETPGARELGRLVAKYCPPTARRRPTESEASPAALALAGTAVAAAGAAGAGPATAVIPRVRQQSFATHVELAGLLKGEPEASAASESGGPLEVVTAVVQRDDVDGGEGLVTSLVAPPRDDGARGAAEGGKPGVPADEGDGEESSAGERAQTAALPPRPSAPTASGASGQRVADEALAERATAARATSDPPASDPPASTGGGDALAARPAADKAPAAAVGASLESAPATAERSAPALATPALAATAAGEAADLSAAATPVYPRASGAEAVAALERSASQLARADGPSRRRRAVIASALSLVAAAAVAAAVLRGDRGGREDLLAVEDPPQLAATEIADLGGSAAVAAADARPAPPPGAGDAARPADAGVVPPLDARRPDLRRLDARPPMPVDARPLPPSPHDARPADARLTPAPADARPDAKLLPRPDAPAPQPKGEPALIKVGANPWGEIFLDGKPAGRTPRTLSVAPGHHEIEVAFPVVSPPRREIYRLDLAAGETRSVLADFTQ